MEERHIYQSCLKIPELKAWISRKKRQRSYGKIIPYWVYDRSLYSTLWLEKEVNVIQPYQVYDRSLYSR